MIRVSKLTDYAIVLLAHLSRSKKAVNPTPTAEINDDLTLLQTGDADGITTAE